MTRLPVVHAPAAPLTQLYRQLGSDAVRLSGSPRVDLPEHVLAALRDAPTGYTSAAGDPALRAAIAEHHEVAVERVVVTAGAMQALDLSFRLLCPAGELLMPRPGFFIDQLVTASIVGIPVDDTGRPDWAAARTSVTADTRAIYANTPVNPTGYVFDSADVDAVHELIVAGDLWLIADEAHTNFVYRGSHRTLLSPALADRTVLIRSFSKDFAMAGWRAGYAIAPEGIAADLAANLERQTVATSALAQAAALAALTGPQDWVVAMAAAARDRGERLAAALDGIEGVACEPPAAGLAVFARVGDSELFAAELLRLGVPAIAGEAFGAPGFVRLQFGGDPDATAEAIERIASHDWEVLHA
jgi:aspartate aminotransferase